MNFLRDLAGKLQSINSCESRERQLNFSHWFESFKGNVSELDFARCPSPAQRSDNEPFTAYPPSAALQFLKI
jgi:hypothetical protein